MAGSVGAPKGPYIKGMSDAELAAFIGEAASMVRSWDAMALGGMSRGYRGNVASKVFYWMRMSDIAIAVKRSRIKAGSWNPNPSAMEYMDEADYFAAHRGESPMSMADYERMNAAEVS